MCRKRKKRKKSSLNAPGCLSGRFCLRIIVQKNMDQKNIFIISGPSGAGEDSIISALKERMNIEVVTTTTTRDMRPGESERQPYHFVTQEAFQDMIEHNMLVEWAQQYNGQYYGVTKKEFDDITSRGSIAVWKIDYKGVISAKSKFPGIIAIFIMAESVDILEQRIRSRSHVTEEYIAERMAYTQEWLQHTDMYDYTVINRQNLLSQAVGEVEAIITKHSKE